MNRADIPMIILCGGKGTRLGAETAKKQKCMIEFDILPMLYYVIDKFYLLGYRQFYLSVGFKAHQVLEVDWSAVFPYASFNYHYCDIGKQKALDCLMEQYSLQYAWVINGDTLITDWLPSTVFEEHLIESKACYHLVTREPERYNDKDVDCGARLYRAYHEFSHSKPCIIDGTYYDIGTPERLEVFAAYLRSCP